MLCDHKPKFCQTIKVTLLDVSVKDTFVTSAYRCCFDVFYDRIPSIGYGAVGHRFGVEGIVS